VIPVDSILNPTALTGSAEKLGLDNVLYGDPAAVAVVVAASRLAIIEVGNRIHGVGSSFCLRNDPAEYHARWRVLK
jgi:hypothetical protein